MLSRPNIILLITHDTGRFISPYGVKTVHTPNCERLAREGVTFDQSYCTAPQCSPSRAGIVTGRFAHANGTMGLTHADFGWGLKATEQPIAKLLGAADYESALLGFQHETGDDQSLGFDYIDVQNRSLLGQADNFARFLDQRAAAKPFYAQFGCWETHRPHLRDNIEPDDSLGVTVPPHMPDTPDTRREMAGLQALTRRMDEGLGQLLDLLDERGLTEETIFILTTDHGLAIPRAKGTLFDRGLETMLIARYPNKWQAGARQPELVSNVDLLPTLLEAAGVEAPANLHGRSFLPLLEGADYQPREEVFAEKTFHGSYDPIRCIRTPTHKYIRYFEKSVTHLFPTDVLDGLDGRDYGTEKRDGPEGLYDVQNDPGEQNNLAADPAYADLLSELRGRLYQWMVDTEDPLLNGPVASPFYHRSIAQMKKP